MYIPDPIEMMESRIERMADEYQPGVCMGCGKKVDYELVCVSPAGDGPMVCAECCPKAHGVSSPNTGDELHGPKTK